MAEEKKSKEKEQGKGKDEMAVKQSSGAMETSAEEMGKPWPEGATTGRQATGPGSAVKGYGYEQGSEAGRQMQQPMEGGSQPRGAGTSQTYPDTGSTPADYESQVRAGGAAYQGGQAAGQGRFEQAGQAGRARQSEQRPMGVRGPMSQSTGDEWHGVDSGEAQWAQGERRWSGEQAGWQRGREYGREFGRRATGQAYEQGSQIMAQAKDRLMGMIDQRRSMAMDRLGSMAEAFRMSSEHLRQQHQEQAAEYTEMAARGVDNVAGFLREQDLGRSMDRIQGFARRQPEMFVGGAFLLGFLLVRFMKSSSGRSSSEYASERGFRSGSMHAPGEWSGRERAGFEEHGQESRGQEFRTSSAQGPEPTGAKLTEETGKPGSKPI